MIVLYMYIIMFVHCRPKRIILVFRHNLLFISIFGYHCKWLLMYCTPSAIHYYGVMNPLHLTSQLHNWKWCTSLFWNYERWNIYYYSSVMGGYKDIYCNISIILNYSNFVNYYFFIVIISFHILRSCFFSSVLKGLNIARCNVSNNRMGQAVPRCNGRVKKAPIKAFGV